MKTVPDASASEARAAADVGSHYDRMEVHWRAMLGDNFHAGYFRDDRDDSPLEVAQERLTELLIERASLCPGKILLDVGSGTGQPAMHAARTSGASVVGITTSAMQVEAANERGRACGLADRVRFQLADAMELPFADATFDAAWGFESLLHVPDRPQALREIFRVLRPAGRLVLADVTEDEPLTSEQTAELAESFRLGSLCTAEAYAQLVSDAGFLLVEALPIGPNTAPTLTAIVRALMVKRDQLQQLLGAEDFASCFAPLSALARVRRKLGYLLLTADKPH